MRGEDDDHGEGTVTGPAAGAPRRGLDELVTQMGQPGFVTRFRRPPSFRETSAHVNPVMLATAPPRSVYVRQWRRHARRCPACASVFRYFGLSLD